MNGDEDDGEGRIAARELGVIWYAEVGLGMCSLAAEVEGQSCPDAGDFDGGKKTEHLETPMMQGATCSSILRWRRYIKVNSLAET